MMLTLISGSFSHGQAIPAKYTCEGEDISPPLQWHDVPDNTESLVLIIDDPDAPDPAAPRMTWVHWLVYNIPANTTGLNENAAQTGLPEGAKQGVNDWHKSTYGGPCPPTGRHRYFHKLYALDCLLDTLSHPTKKQLESAMKNHILASAELVGTYIKGGKY